MNALKIIMNYDAQTYAYIAFASFVVHIVCLLIIQMFLGKMRAASDRNHYVPRNLFSANPVERFKIYGFIFSYPRINGTSEFQYFWIRIARLSFLLFFVAAGFYLYHLNR